MRNAGPLVVARPVCAAPADPAHTRRANSIQLWRVWSAQLPRIGAATAGRNVTTRNAIEVWRRFGADLHMSATAARIW